MTYEPFRAAYVRTMPPPRRTLGSMLRDLAEDTRADLSHLGEHAARLLWRIRGTFRSRTTLCMAAAAAGLATGMLLMREPAPQAIAAPVQVMVAAARPAIVGGMCEQEPTPLPATAEAPRARREERPLAAPPRAVSAPRKKLPAVVIAKPASAPTPSVSPARRRALQEEAARAERAEVASAYYARTRKRAASR